MKRKIIFAAVCAGCCLAGAAMSQQGSSTREPVHAVSITAVPRGEGTFYVLRLMSNGDVQQITVHESNMVFSNTWRPLSDYRGVAPVGSVSSVGTRPAK